MAHWRWPHFSLGELACRCKGQFCSGEYWHDPAFLDSLEALRTAVGRPLLLNSGHRCDLWNAHVGGASRSMHKTIAVDIALAEQDRHELLRQAERLDFTGIGLGKTFLHLDRRVYPARWYYPGSKPSWRI